MCSDKNIHDITKSSLACLLFWGGSQEAFAMCLDNNIHEVTKSPHLWRGL